MRRTKWSLIVAVVAVTLALCLSPAATVVASAASKTAGRASTSAPAALGVDASRDLLEPVGEPATYDLVSARAARGAIFVLVAAALVAWLRGARVKDWMLGPPPSGRPAIGPAGR